MYTQCIHNVYTMYTQCIHNVYTMYTIHKFKKTTTIQSMLKSQTPTLSDPGQIVSHY